MADIAEIIGYMNKLAPENRTDPDFDDSVGLLVGVGSGKTDTALLCLDATESVIRQAVKEGAKLVISHHPIIFRGIKEVTDRTPTGRAILLAAENGISVYSAHTNLDFCDGGVTDYAAKLLGLLKTEPMYVSDGVKIGRIGALEKPLSLTEFEKAAAAAFGDDQIRSVGAPDRRITKAAVIAGGAGNIEYIEKAIALGADCYVSGDFPHHALLYAREQDFSVLSMQHFAMESVYMIELSRILNENIKDTVFKVASETSPTHKGA